MSAFLIVLRGQYTQATLFILAGIIAESRKRIVERAVSERIAGEAKIYFVATSSNHSRKRKHSIISATRVVVISLLLTW